MLMLVWPWMLLLVPLPFIYRWWRTPRPLNIPMLRAPGLLANNTLGQNSAPMSRKLPLFILSAIWILLIIAIARPQWQGEPQPLPATARDILLAVDISRSMAHEDMHYAGRQLNRLSAVKEVVSDFVLKRQGDRLGLILFGERAYLQAPLTFDRRTLQVLLEEAQIGFAGNGTAIGEAIGLGIKRLRDRPDDHRVLILLTDGANTAGELKPLKAAQLAAEAGVKIYTIGIGADRQERMGLFNLGSFMPASDLDEKTLQQISAATGGRYFRARSPQELADIYNQLNKLEPVEQDGETLRPIKTLYHWPLAGALICSLLLGLISTGGRRDV